MSSNEILNTSLKDFFQTTVPELITQKNCKKITFLEGALLIANGKNYETENDWEYLTHEFIKNFFPKKIYSKDLLSFLSGPSNYLIGLEILYGKKSREIPAYITIKKSIDQYIIAELPLMIKCAKNSNIKTFHYDLLYGICSYLNFLLEFYSPLDAEDLERQIISYLLLICTEINGTFPFLVIKRNNEINEHINLGVSHGLAGIYYVLKKFCSKRKSSNMNLNIITTLDSIEKFILKCSIKEDGYLSIPGIVNYPDLKPLKTETNFSWCYGMSGYTFLYSFNLLERTNHFNKQGRLFVSSLLYLVDKYKNNKNNIIFKSSTFCHGLSGLIYELFLLGEESASLNLLDLLLQMKSNDKIGFYDIHHEDELRSDFNMLDGSISTWLVIQSLLTKKRFIGDFLFGK